MPKLRCPKCGTTSTFSDRSRPVCSKCGFGAAAAPTPAARPAAMQLTQPAWNAGGASAYGAPAYGAPAYDSAPYGQAVYVAPPYGAPAYARPPSNGMAIAGMVLGISALAMFFVWFLSPILAITGIALSAAGMGRAKRMGGAGHGMAIAGMVCSIIAVALWALIWLVILSVFAEFK